jgi:phosphate acetyltransferase
MVRSLYITTTEAYSGKSLVSLGLTNQILLQTSRVGVFRPVIEGTPDDGHDKNIELLLSYFNLGIDYEDTFAFYRDEVSSRLIAGEQTEVLNTIFEKYKALESLCDFVVCIGSDFAGEGSALEFDFNAEVARNLGAPVIIVSGGVGRNVNTIVGVIHAMRDAYVERGCEVIGAVANRVDSEIAAVLLERLRNEMSGDGMLLSVIPAHKALSSPTMGEVTDYLGAQILYGSEQLDRLAYHNLVIAMQIPNYLPYLTDNSLLITSGDRSDVLVSALQAHLSRNYPQIAGIVLTGGLHPPPTVARLLDGMRPTVPILSTTRDTFETAAKVREVRSYITPDSASKIR